MTRGEDALAPGEHARGSLALDLISGATAAIVAVTATVSFSSLVFSGVMRPFLAEGIALALFSALLVSSLGLALYRIPTLVLTPNPVAPIVAIVVAAAVAELPADAPPEVIYVNGLGALIFSSFITGAFMYALGRFRLVSISRYVPYPILIGMTGVVGWMFVAGLPRVLGVTVAELWEWSALSSDQTLFISLALALALALLIVPPLVSPRARGAALPTMLVLFVAGFHIWRLVEGHSLSELAESGGLLRVPDTGGQRLPLPDVHDLERLDWRALLAAPAELASLAALTAIKATLMLSAIEVHTKLRLSAERDMEWAGVCSMIVAPLGGFPAHISISMSVIIDRLGGTTARAFVGYISVVALAFFGGSSLLAWLPVPLVAGVLAYIGISMLLSALVTEGRKMSRREYAVAALIVLVQAASGFGAALLTGLLAAVGLFLYEYSRVDIIARAWTGRERTSSAPRDDHDRLVLLEAGDLTQIFELRGYMFFGTCERLVQTIEASVAVSPPQSLILDFHSVSGMDVSSAASCGKIATLAERAGIDLSLCGLNPEMERGLRRVGVLDAPRASLIPDLDRALERAEERVLTIQRDDVPGARALASLAGVEEMTLTPGSQLFARGERLRHAYFVRRGALSLLDGEEARGVEVGAGGFLGAGPSMRPIESVYTAVAREDCALYVLNAEALRRLEAESPQVALIFHRLMATRRSATTSDGDFAAFDALAAELVEHRVASGTTLIREGEFLPCMYLVESGRLDVVIAGSSARLRAIGPGDILGEISYYTQSAATATVVARTEVVARRLDRAALRQIEERSPSVAASLHRRFSRGLAERLVQDTHARPTGR